MLPNMFLHGHLGDVNAWNNIPLPLVNATETFEKCFGNLSRLIKDIIAENKRKSEFIVSKFKKMDTRMSAA